MKKSKSVSDIILKTEGIGVTYDESVVALENVSLSIPAAKLTAILGPSGCGKTTLLKVIAGLIDPSTGVVKVREKQIAGPGPDRALVFQDFALLPWATVLQNVAFGLRARGVSKKEREKTALHYIREVGLLGFENKYPHQLSGGMRQRTGLARALTINSDILLMDEPFSAVDEQMRRKLQEDLLNLLRIENKTVIFVTHSIEEAVYLADQVVILSGRPGSIADIVYPEIDRRGDIDLIRRQSRYMELVDEIWSSLKRYVE